MRNLTKILSGFCLGISLFLIPIAEVKAGDSYLYHKGKNWSIEKYKTNSRGVSFVIFGDNTSSMEDDTSIIGYVNCKNPYSLMISSIRVYNRDGSYSQNDDERIVNVDVNSPLGMGATLLCSKYY